MYNCVKTRQLQLKHDGLRKKLLLLIFSEIYNSHIKKKLLRCLGHKSFSEYVSKFSFLWMMNTSHLQSGPHFSSNLLRRLMLDSDMRSSRRFFHRA